MMGPAIFELYSSNYKESKRKNEKNDGNGNPTSIIKNKKSLLKDNKLNGIYNLLSFDNNQKFKQDKKTVSSFSTREVLTNINEEEKIKCEISSPDKKEIDTQTKKNNSEFFKSSSDGFKIKSLIDPLSSSNSMQALNYEKNQLGINKTIARFPVIYVGQKILDKKYTLPMLPWIVSEFRREVLPLSYGNNSPNFGSNLSFTSNSSSGSNFGLIIGPTKKERKKIWLEITDRSVLGIEKHQTDVDQLNKIIDSENENLLKKNELTEGLLFSHKHEWICKIQRQENEEGDLYSFAYLIRDFGSSVGQNNENKPYTVHIFECEKSKNMTDLIALIKSVNINLQKSEELGMDSSDSLQIDYSENSNNLESILGNSQQYEVMYLGKINLNEKQISSSFIDEAVLELSSNENEDFKYSKAKSYLSTDTCLKDDLEKINKSSMKDNLSENKTCLDIKKNVAKISEQGSYKKNQLSLPENNYINMNTQSLDDTTRNSILNDLQEVNRFNQKTAEAFVQRRNRYSNQSLTDQTIQENINSFNELNDIKRSSSAKSPSKNNNCMFNVKNAQLKLSNSKIKSTSADIFRCGKQISLPVYSRPRTNSGGSHDFLQRHNSILQLRAQNRTMLFLIGRYDICLLCLDNQQVLLNKSFNTITNFSQGANNSNCFGFICKEQKNFSKSHNKQLDSSIGILSSSNKNKLSCFSNLDKLDAAISTNELNKNINKNDNLNEKSLIDQENYVGYVFKGENEKLVNELMYSLKQAFRNAHHAIQQSKIKDNVFCTDCPLYFYHNLCVDLLEVSVEKAQCIILTKIGELSSTEYKEIMSNYEGVQVNSIREQNEILMSLIKRFYEKKQLKHSECKTNKKHENLRTTSFADNLKQRAKKSLSTSFETILKLRHTDSNVENLRENLAKLSEELKIQNQEKENLNDKCTTRSTLNLVNNEIKDQNLNLNDQPRPRSSTISSSKDLHREMTNDLDNLDKNIIDKNESNLLKPKSSRLDAYNSMRKKSESLPPKSPLLNIFIKSSNQNKSNNISDENLVTSKTNLNENNSLSKEHNLNFLKRNSLTNDFISEKQINENTFNFTNNNDELLDVLYDENGIPYEVDEENTVSWRKAIFSSIHCNTRQLVLNNYNGEKLMKNVTFDDGGLFLNGKRKRTREELRELWRKAIYQQITLIKMEKENLLIQENQHEAEDKRLKLDYDDVINCNNIEQWNQILTRCDEFAMKICNNEVIGNFDCFGNTQNFNLTKYGSFLNSAVTPVEFAEAVQNGCPKNRRGEIWCLLADIRQRNGVRPTCSPSEATVDFDTNYRVLLQQLTSQQHAILVDLGRTFPKHPYYAQPLGSGQLGLFNLLKAYSLFDKEVGYCQGLSFVAGILLLHMPEDDAFEMMKHLLFFLGLRKQYKPDMSALQMQFYQLTRLLYDHHRDIYEHFEKYEISPVLYAAPWFLTLFASQFSIGFVARLFDFIFLFGIEAIFRISLSLFAIHKQALLLCNSFENIIHYLKNDLVKTENYQLESMFSIAFALDITRQLIVYEIEYQVIQEEIQYKPLTITYNCFNKDFKTGIDKNLNLKQLKLNNTSTKNLKVRKVSCSAIQQPQTLYHHLKQRKISSTVAVGSDSIEKTDFSNDSQANEKIKDLEKENKTLKNRNMEILDQLHVAQSSVYSLESSLDSYKSTIKRLETRVRALEDERDALLHMVAK